MRSSILFILSEICLYLVSEPKRILTGSERRVSRGPCVSTKCTAGREWGQGCLTPVHHRVAPGGRSTWQMNMDPTSCIETVRGGGLGGGPGAGPPGYKGLSSQSEPLQ